MSLHARSIGGRTKDWFKLWKRRPRSSSIRPDERTGSFSNAWDFAVNGGQFVDASYVNELKIDYINNVISTREVVFELLEPYTCLDATKDSSARYPPPKCHPQTRLKIRQRLEQWLLNEPDGWKMLWVRGSAGTGKSAVAQSFGDSCGEAKRHGASYFFSRPAGRDKLETVVPTLVYQLAATIPEYRSLIGRELANNPLLLRKSPPVQFRELIVEPFATLQRRHPCKPIVVILDGLDECEGENAQRQILQMITDAVHTNPGLPLRWLVFSRPEAHLKNAFFRNLVCGRDELTIDEECRENVERYVKDRFAEIKAAYNDVTPEDWPSENQLEELLDAISGLFVFAATCLNFIDDPVAANPRSQLHSLLLFIRRSEGIMSRNPLAALDLLYSRILERIPSAVFETSWRVLACMSYENKFLFKFNSAQALCNFLRLDQHDFYQAARGLYSVMNIPEQEDAARSPLRFYHASFQDFLLNPNRSGKFVIREQKVLEDILPLALHWCGVDLTTFHTQDGPDSGIDHEHDSLPGLTWASKDNEQLLSRSIMEFLDFGIFHPGPDIRLDCVNEDILSQLSDFEFRYWYPRHIFYLVQLSGLDPSTGLVRTEPSSPTDDLLFKYFNIVIGNGIAKPAVFPLKLDLPDDKWIREYFLIWYGVKSVIVWRTRSPDSRAQGTMFLLRCDVEPSEAQISEYKRDLEQIHWDEARAALEMK